MNANFVGLLGRLRSVTVLDLTDKDNPVIIHLIKGNQLYEAGHKHPALARGSSVKLLLEDLDKIKCNDNRLFKSFVKTIKQLNRCPENYYGLRQEIRTTVSLLDKKVEFEKSETPDFILLESGLGIECTSCHLHSNRGIPDSLKY